MVVYIDDNSVHCFGGCGTMDPLDIVSRQLGLSKAAAWRELVDRYSTSITPAEEAEASRLRMLKEYVNACHGYLTEEHRQLLRRRGLTDRTIDNYCIGFHPESFNGLTDDELMELGIYRRDGEGNIVSDFTSKLVLPCYHNGKLVYCVAWNGTGIEGEPKYAFPAGWPRPVCGTNGENQVLVEGPFDLITCDQAGLPALCCLGASTTREQKKYLAGLDALVILFDGDDPGEKAARELAVELFPNATVGSMPGGHDPNSLFLEVGSEEFRIAIDNILSQARDPLDMEIDYLLTIENPRQAAKHLNGTVVRLLKKVSPTEQDALAGQIAKKLKSHGITKESILKQLKHTPEDLGNQAASEDKNQATELYEAAREAVDLYFGSDKVAYAVIKIEGHLEMHPVRGENFRRFLQGISKKTLGKIAGPDVFRQVIDQLDADAYMERRTIDPQNRVAWHEGCIYYDMSDNGWSTVRISGEGWERVFFPPPLFKREDHQKAQVEPSPEGDIEPLFDLLGLTGNERLLLKVYLVYCLVPDVPKVILYVMGEKGSGKTDLTRAIRQMVDPSIVYSLKEPTHEDRTLAQMAHHYAPLFDNINVMKPWFVRLCCTAATGESDERRKLYTDDGTVIFQFTRPILLNAINRLGIEFSDFQDRMILIKLNRIEETKRIERSVFWQKFEEIKPFAFGGMLNALSRAMAIKPEVRLERLPRMADFATWGCAIAEALGYTREEFLRAYEANMRIANQDMIEDHPLAAAVCRLMDSTGGEWEGEPTNLLAELEDVTDPDTLRQRSWPKSPSALSRKLNEIKSNLRDAGITFEKSQTSGANSRRVIRIEKRSLIEGEETASEGSVIASGSI